MDRLLAGKERATQHPSHGKGACPLNVAAVERNLAWCFFFPPHKFLYMKSLLSTLVRHALDDRWVLYPSTLKPENVHGPRSTGYLCY